MSGSKEHKQHTVWVNLVAGGFGGALAKSVLAPFQRIVVLKQLGEHKQLSAFQLANRIVEKEGVLGFWRGNLTMMLIRFPYSGIQFVLYGKCKFFFQSILGYDGSEKESGGMLVALNKFLLKCGAGGLSATIAGAAVYPGEVVRLRLMSGEERFRGIANTTRLIWRETNSPRNFYRGLNASLAQRVPDILINFALYETVKFAAIDRGAPDLLATFAGGSAAALGAIAFSFPLDVAKRRIGMAGQGASKVVYRGLRHCLSEVYKEGGVRALYAGASVEAIRCVPQVILMWYCIEKLQETLSRIA